MGAADVVPGVSGGTIAFITGIYDELIDSIKAFDLRALSLLRQGQFRTLWLHVNGGFLLALVLGILASVLTLAGVITYALEHHAILVGAFFFGLIAGSAVYILRQVERWHVGPALWLSVGILAALAIGELRPAQLSVEYHWLFLSGAVAICAMILPGVSGSFILLLLGMYEPVLNAVKSLQWSVLAVFGLGCAAGLLSFVRLLSWFLHHHRRALLAFLTGILTGSLSIIWPWKMTAAGELAGPETPITALHNVWPWQFAAVGDTHLAGAVVCAVVGLALVLVIEKLAGRQL